MKEHEVLMVDTSRACAPVAATANAASRPEFIRLPKAGTLCPHTGLTRSTLNSYILPNAENGYKPEVHSYAVRRRGTMKGIRLIDYDNLCEFVRKHGGTK